MDSRESTPLTVGFVGASHLAYVSGIASAVKGQSLWNIVCYAPEHTIQNIQEPDFSQSLADYDASIQITSHPDDLRKCDVVYIAIDVPTNNLGVSDLTPIYNAVENVKSHLSPSATLIILSQVPPGFTRKVNFDQNRLFYQVETLIFGRAMERALYPERFMIGKSTKDTILPAKLVQYLDAFNCPIFEMAYESAELSKISINLYLTATVTTTNMLAQFSEAVGADWEDIAATLKLDKRIGSYAYLKPGLGLSGGNLERDMATLQHISHECALFSSFIDAQKEDSQFRSNWPFRMLQEMDSSKDSLIGVLGLSYKENTNSLKNSASIRFLEAIGDAYQVVAYDPVVKNLVGFSKINILQDAQQVINQSNFLAILTPWPEFINLDYSQFYGNILDPYRMVQTKPSDAIIHSLGRNSC